MQRICSSLSNDGFGVLLVGRKLGRSLPLETRKYDQKRLSCFFTKGKWFYLEYNIRLFWFLLFKNFDIVCAIDLDTILPVLWASKLKNRKRAYDAHELFTELKEVKTNPFSSRVWSMIGRLAVPQFTRGYTVCDSIAEKLFQIYGVRYETIRNLPVRKNASQPGLNRKTFIYTGAVNEARGFEYLIPAMQYVDHPLIICGDGNFMQQALALVNQYKVGDKIVFRGMLHPQQLDEELKNACIGINFVENTGLNQYYSLANKFFDYIQMGIPQITMNFPEYKRINDRFHIAVLINELSAECISEAMNNLMSDVVLYENLKKNCVKAGKELTWENEEGKLLRFYNSF